MTVRCRNHDWFVAARGPLSPTRWASRQRACLIVAAFAALAAVAPASGTPPALLHTPGYQSPVRGGPNDLLTITGNGLQRTDRVAYRAYAAGDRPQNIPAHSSASEGVAPVVKFGDRPYFLTVRLPGSIDPKQAYRLWVVNEANEWSEPVSINDPRPMWFTPAYVFSTADFAGLGRTVRIVGRNLRASAAAPARIRLRGRQSYFVQLTADRDNAAQEYVSEGKLPTRLEPGAYSVAFSGDGRTWEEVPDQQLEVRPDPIEPPRIDVSKPEYGSCRPDDGEDDTGCFRDAFEAARRAGSGAVVVPPGTWDIGVRQLHGDEQRNGFILARNVNLQGAGSKLTHVIRHDVRESPAPGALLTLTGGNSVTGISFTDDTQYESLDQSRATIQLGSRSESGPHPTPVDNVVISANTFYRVGRAIADSGLPIRHLVITHNEFGGYDNGLLLTGAGARLTQPYRIDDAIIRWNRFVPGSYLNISQRQGSIATQIGASSRLDFSSNVADGTSREGLQQPDDPPGWRAAFFWNLNNNHEGILIAENRVDCAGDKAGDGEAIAFDWSGDTFGFDAAGAVEAAGVNWLRVRARLLHEHYGQPVPTDYYRGHWILTVDRSDIEQARRLESYSENPDGTITLRVSPDWDVVPDKGRVVIGTLYWQVYVVANEVTQAAPPCRKSNLTDSRGGLIGFWAPVADSVIHGNEQTETDGIGFLVGYSARAASCPTCVGSVSFVASLEILGNVIDGEYDWSSDCSWSGIHGYFVATPTPEAPPPILGSGVVIAHNTISHADGPRGGAIEFAAAGKAGPDPGDWPMVQGPLIYGNVIRDIGGQPPHANCRKDQRGRVGIRLEGKGNIRDAVLDSNRCEAVENLLEDSGAGTMRICSAWEANSCECPVR